MTGLLFLQHGTATYLGFPTVPMFANTQMTSPSGIAGLIALVGGILLVLGLFTRPVAFIASGEMAVAYFWMHWGTTGSPWWWENRGEVVMLFSFIWLFFAAAGAGRLSLDAELAARRTSPAGS